MKMGNTKAGSDFGADADLWSERDSNMSVHFPYDKSVPSMPL